ncbi:MAG TPA: phosphoglucosamine mutase, partial [Vicinamibacteria bacterium]|nr:phosphoglucosamine mutase [Vicinamibacteria bacterium]
RPLSDLAADLEVYPQVLKNVRVREKADLEAIADVKKSLDVARHALEGRGRLVVRYSGTEPLLRVMAEGPDEGELQELTGAIADSVTRTIGAAAHA